MIVSRTPFRVSLFGGGSDYPLHLQENCGAILGGAIDKYCFLTLRQLTQDFGSRYRIRYTHSESAASVDGIQHPAVRAVLTQYGVKEATEINHSSDLPARSGIGSSSAFIVGLLAALKFQREGGIHSTQIAREAIDFEQKILKEVVGYQDTILASRGSFGLIEFQKGDLNYTYSPITNHEYIDELSKNFLLIRTGEEQRVASTIATEQVKKMKMHANDLNELADIARSMFSEMKNETANERSIAKLLNYSWEVKKRQSNVISNRNIDDLVSLSFSKGAIGAKLLGAGHSGFLLVVVPNIRQEKFLQEMRSHKIVKFGWSKTGVLVERSFE